MSAFTTTGANRPIGSVAGVVKRMASSDTWNLDLDSVVFDDTTDGTAVQFNQGMIMGAGKSLTSLGALSIAMAAGAFDLTVKLADAAGAQKMSITDSGDVEVASINSDGDAQFVDGQFDGSVNIDGSLTVTGTKTYIGGEVTAFADNHLVLNDQYTAVSAQTAGLVANYLPTATTTDTTGAGVFTAGVDGASDPTVTVSSSVFSADDIIMISGSANNDGIYEVVSDAAGTLTIKSTANGISDQDEDWTNNQFTAETDTGATITKINVSVLRSGTDGAWEVGIGSSTPLSFSDVLTSASASPWTTDGAVVNLVTDGNTVTIGSNTAGGKLYIDPDADELQFQVDGHTTQTGAVGRIGQFDTGSVAPMLELQLDAAAFSVTGGMRGLQVDFANASSLSSSTDARGIELLGETNAGAGDSVGVFIDSAWDYGMKVDNTAGINLFDDREVSFGTDYDAWITWNTSSFQAEVWQFNLGSADVIQITSSRVSTEQVVDISGEAYAVGDVLAVSTDSKLYQCDADHATPARRRPHGIALTAAGAADEANHLIVALNGMSVRVNTDLSGATVGDRVYASESAPGEVTTTPPSTGEVWQVGIVTVAANASSARIRLLIQHVLDN